MLNGILRMKYHIFLILLLSLHFLSSCKDESRERRIIHQAETLFNTNPDSVLYILNSIPLPEEMTPSLATQWSMLYARSADKTGRRMPYVNQLQIAWAYYKNKKLLPEMAEAGLYLGRSLVENKEYEKAMLTYSDALLVALEIENYNRAGYICSYMGDLYQVDGDYSTAANKYEEGNRYFHQAGNMKSYAYGLVNAAFCYAIDENDQTALFLLQKADSVATALNNAEVMAYVYNGLGNIYMNLTEYNLAESYLLKGIQLDSTDLAPNYASLAKIYFYKNEKQKAELYLSKAKIPTQNQFTPISVTYMYYKINKKDKNYEKALKHLEEYVMVEDSIDEVSQNINMLEIEKRYNHILLQNENKQLKIDKQQNQILLFLLFFICSFLFIIYLLIIIRKNQHIWEQEQVINDQNKKIYNASIALEQKNKALEQQFKHIKKAELLLHLQGSLEEETIKYRKLKENINLLQSNLIILKRDRLLLSSTAKKLQKMSQIITPNISHSLITDRYWHTIEEQVKEVYPTLPERMESMKLTTAERRLCYLTLFQFDTTAISILLNITPESVNKQRLRARQKFNLAGTNADLYEYITTI